VASSAPPDGGKFTLLSLTTQGAELKGKLAASDAVLVGLELNAL
jgi:hypothetical protein